MPRLLPAPPPRTPKQTEEQLKLAASGLQAVAITVLAGVLLAPALNPSLLAPAWAQAVTVALALAAEGAAFALLRYITVAPSPSPATVPPPQPPPPSAAEEDPPS